MTVQDFNYYLLWASHEILHNVKGLWPKNNMEILDIKHVKRPKSEACDGNSPFRGDRD